MISEHSLVMASDDKFQRKYVLNFLTWTCWRYSLSIMIGLNQCINVLRFQNILYLWLPMVNFKENMFWTFWPGHFECIKYILIGSNQCSNVWWFQNILYLWLPMVNVKENICWSVQPSLPSLPSWDKCYKTWDACNLLMFLIN